MTGFVQKGEILTLTAPYDVAVNGGALIGCLFGVATVSVLSGASGEFLREGVVEIAKDTSVFAMGDRVYWDNTNKVATSTVSGNMLIGRAVQAQLTGDTIVRLVLGGSGTLKPFQSAEQTGTGSAQSIAHGLGVVPAAVIIYPTDLTPATLGSYVVTLGTHTTTNVVVTVTTSKKYIVVALA